MASTHIFARIESRQVQAHGIIFIELKPRADPGLADETAPPSYGSRHSETVTGDSMGTPVCRRVDELKESWSSNVNFYGVLVLCE